MMYGWGIGGWGVFLMAVTTVLFLVLLAAGVVALTGIGGGRLDTAAPEQVLADRFARGEIDDDEYLRRLQVLGSAAAAHHRR
jgi:putative membrane protein